MLTRTRQARGSLTVTLPNKEAWVSERAGSNESTSPIIASETKRSLVIDQSSFAR
jgi:hypothetical protein